MKIIRSAVPAGDSSGGYVDVPQNREWLKEWIENKGQWVELECGHIEDIGDRSLIVIKAFKGCTVGCERCNKFVSVVRTMVRKTPPVKQPDEPLF
jgi:hypothetical protein